MKPEATVEPVLLSPDQAADALGCGRTQVYALLATNQLRSVKIGRLRRIPTAEVHRYVENLLAEVGDQA